MQRLSPTERIIAWRLAEGRPVSRAEFEIALWSNDPQGGPEYSGPIISMMLNRLRRKLPSICIDTRWTFGWSVPPEQVAALRDILAEEIRLNTLGSIAVAPKVLRRPTCPAPALAA